MTDEQVHLRVTNGGRTFISYLNQSRTRLTTKGYLNGINEETWEITERGLQKLEESNQTNKIENIVKNTKSNNILVAKSEIGTGSESIYVFSYPKHRELAELQNKRFWLHKIGRTRSEDLHRVLQQTNTAVPEKPEILLHIRTDSSILMENAIHTILKLRGKHSKDSPGNEWFKTNCSEIEEIYLFIMNIKK